MPASAKVGGPEIGGSLPPIFFLDGRPAFASPTVAFCQFDQLPDRAPQKAMRSKDCCSPSTPVCLPSPAAPDPARPRRALTDPAEPCQHPEGLWSTLPRQIVRIKPARSFGGAIEAKTRITRGLKNSSGALTRPCVVRISLFANS